MLQKSPATAAGQAKDPVRCSEGFASAFTLFELRLIVAILTILAALLLPTLTRAKLAAKSAACKNNLRQIGIGLRLYLDAFNKFPLDYAWDLTNVPRVPTAVPASEWYYTLAPYCGGKSTDWAVDSTFSCPYEQRVGYAGKGAGYWYNAVGTKDTAGWSAGPDGTMTFFDPVSALGLGVLGWPNLPVPESLVLVPSDMIAIGEIDGFGWPWPRTSGYCHWPSANAVFCDGHVESSNPAKIPQKVDADGNREFKPDAAHLKRYNNDDLPHPETWR